ncbi:hypothetical protein [Jatrophihabitans sp.]|uniref:hypothetical protein n=1 Tax=Jatrophihabitans sp. TaxID=1932789 RepID=UPI0030C68125|nr:hypothetical protein [Jatrophihabitans sp.]
MSQETDLTAIKAALNAALPSGQAQAYEYDQTPATTSYVRVDLTRRYTGRFLASGEEAVGGGRLVTHYVGKTVSNVRELRRITTSVLEDKVIGTAGPFVFEAEDPIDDNAGFFEAFTFWTL